MNFIAKFSWHVKFFDKNRGAFHFDRLALIANRHYSAIIAII